MAEGYRKSMRVTKVNYRSKVVHKSAENNGTMMVNGGQWQSTRVSGSQRKSTRAFGAQKSMEVNQSQRNKLVARELAEVNEGQREVNMSSAVNTSTPPSGALSVSFYLSLHVLCFLVFFIINYFDAA